MEFKAEYRSYIGRYFGTLWGTAGMILVFLFGFQLKGKGFAFSINSIEKFYFSDIKLTLFFLIIPVAYHVNSYLVTNRYPKLVRLGKSSLTIHFFKKTSLDIKYSEINSLDYSEDRFKDFIFNLKNKKQEKFHPAIRNKEKAFEMINKKIKEAKRRIK